MPKFPKFENPRVFKRTFPLKLCVGSDGSGNMMSKKHKSRKFFKILKHFGWRVGRRMHGYTAMFRMIGMWFLKQIHLITVQYFEFLEIRKLACTHAFGDQPATRNV